MGLQLPCLPSSYQSSVYLNSVPHVDAQANAFSSELPLQYLFNGDPCFGTLSYFASVIINVSLYKSVLSLERHSTFSTKFSKVSITLTFGIPFEEHYLISAQQLGELVHEQVPDEIYVRNRVLVIRARDSLNCIQIFYKPNANNNSTNCHN